MTQNSVVMSIYQGNIYMISVILVIIFSLISICLWIFFFVKFNKMFSPEAMLQNIEQEVDKILIEINREFDRDLALIEARRKGLKELIDEADKRTSVAVSTLEKKQQEALILSQMEEIKKQTQQTTQTQKAASSYQKNVTNKKMKASEVPETLDLFFDALEKNELEDQKPPYDFTDNAFQINKPAVESKTTEVYTTSIYASEDLVSSEKSLKTTVLEMYRQGISLELIAEKSNVSITEVQMIVNMFN